MQAPKKHAVSGTWEKPMGFLDGTNQASSGAMTYRSCCAGDRKISRQGTCSTVVSIYSRQCAKVTCKSREINHLSLKSFKDPLLQKEMLIARVHCIRNDFRATSGRSE